MKSARSLSCAMASLCLAPYVHAQDKPSFTYAADARLRLEQDWNSQTAAGVERPDRLRARTRVRLGAAYDLGGGFTARGRVRTGLENSQQGANITFADFDDNRTDEFKVLVDQYSLAWKSAAATAEIGRMAFPFFTPNEYFWDGDLSPLGAAGSFALPVADGKMRFIAGAFELPAGLREYSGNLFAGQGVFERGPVTLAGGLFDFEADRNDPDRRLLLEGNGERDYRVVAINALYKLATAKPLVFNADLYRNLKDYDDAADVVGRVNDGEDTGYVLSVAWGDLSAPGRYQLGYRWFEMEKLAVNASYAHDDVARFGTASQAALTDLKGHDFYANWAVTKALTVGVRTMFTERLTNREDGQRARLDFIYKLR